MWIVPKSLELTNPSTSSVFVPDTVASSADLTLLESTIGSSLMWRSKPSPLQTWSRRWSRVNWIPHLFGRTLKPSQHISFETALTSSLEDIRANRLVRLEREAGSKTPVISGHTSDGTYNQLNLFNASSRTSKDTSRLDSTASSATWKKMVTAQRGEYSQRKKLARHTNANESSYLPTPSATSYGNNQGGAAGRTGKVRHSLESMARHNLWPTPAYLLGMTQKPTHSVPTPTASDHIERKNTNVGASNGELNFKTNKSVSLDRYVKMWPTPRASEHKDCGPVGSKSHTHMDKRSYLCAKAKDPDQPRGLLNPTWVEWLMGVPTGWTGLDSWGTE